MLTADATHPHPADPACQQAEDAQSYRRLLHELIDMGMDMARSVHGQATGKAGGQEPARVQDATAAFDRLSRAVRRTVAMARHVAQPLPQRPDPARERAAERALGRRRTVREVEDVSQWSDSELDAEIAREARTELCERLDAPELDDEIGTRPVADVIADICRDLGLGRLPGTHPWQRRTQDMRGLCARAARPPGSPPCPASGGPAQGWGETWRPRPCTEEIGAELAQQLREPAPRIRGP